MQKFKTRLENFYDTSSIWGGHITVPDEVVQYFLKDKVTRLLVSINGADAFHAALMPKGKGIYFININSEIRKKMKWRNGQEAEIILIKDDSKYGMPMPEEFDELLKIDDEGNEIFHTLTKGKQRSLLHIIGKPKNSDTRLKKAIVVIDYLKMMNGKLDFKLLNEAFKEANKR